MINPSYFNLITCKAFSWVQFDTYERNIELFVNGGIKYFHEWNSINFADFDVILSHIWMKNIENFKILGSFHSEKLEQFLKQYKYPLFRIYKTKEILWKYSQELKNAIENRSVLRCSGTIPGIELRNLLLLQWHQEYEKSDERRNITIQKLWDALWAQTNWNTAYTWKVELGYPIEDFESVYHIILGFLWHLNWARYISIDRIRFIDSRFTINLSRISNLTQDLFYRDNEKKIFTSEYVTDGIMVNEILWTIKNDLLPDHFLRLICLYFSTHRNRSLELWELIEFNKTIQDSWIQEKQLTADNLRKNYIKQINLKFRESYDTDLLDMKWSIIKAKSLIWEKVVYPEEK